MDNSLGGTSSASAIKTTASSPSDYIAKETVKPLLWIVHKMAFRLSGAQLDVGSRQPEPEVGEDLLTEGDFELQELLHVVSVVEGYLPSLIVQVDPDAPWLFLQAQRGGRHGQRCVTAVPVHPQGPDLLHGHHE